MEADDISKLVEFANSLVYEQTGQHLEPVDKEILRQTLSGKKNSDIHLPNLKDSYVQRRRSVKLWNHLSEVTKQKVRKKNVLKILQVIQFQRSQAEHPENKKAEESAPPSRAQEFQSSDQASQPDNPDETNSSSHGLPTFMKPEMPLLFSLGICLSFFGLSWGLSWLAGWYGVTNHLAGQLPKAQVGYKVALKLTPWSAAAHYNQGAAYEDEQNYERAHAEYQIAIEGGLVPAYNNQARLYILEGKYDAAVSLLRIGLPLAKNEDDLQYSMLKNLGWARLEQGRLSEARLNLEDAIKLKSTRAPAYCLMAQMLERQGDKKNALVEWENCLGLSYKPQTPEEDKWLELASQRLSAKGGQNK